MRFDDFFLKCQQENTVSDFESYLSYSIFEKGEAGQAACTLEDYSRMRDRAFEKRDEDAARRLFELSGAARWNEGEWEGAMR